MTAEFRVCTLASGSSGNSIYAECEDGAVLIDAGISARRVEAALRAVGGDPRRVCGAIITHEHTDHARTAGVLQRRYQWPFFMTAGTYRHHRNLCREIPRPQLFAPGQTLPLGGFLIQTLATPHDGAEPVALVLEREGVRCGVLTDLGHPFPELRQVLPTLDAVILESNYCPEMLRRGAYPAWLKRRIRSSGGHLSNPEAARLIADCPAGRLRLVMLAHLSEHNNTPELAAATIEEIAGAKIKAAGMQVHIAPRHQPSAMIVVRAGALAEGKI